MPRPDHSWNVRQVERAKLALHPLPVLPNGVPECVVRNARAVIRAAQAYAQEQGDASGRQLQRIEKAAIWIAYRCSDLSVPQLSEAFGRTAGTLSTAIIRTDRSLRDGGINGIVDGVLQVLVYRGQAMIGVDRRRPEILADVKLPCQEPQARAEKSDRTQCDPRWHEARKLRDLGWAYRGIAKRTGLDERDVADFCGVELDHRRAR